MDTECNNLKDRKVEELGIMIDLCLEGSAGTWQGGMTGHWVRRATLTQRAIVVGWDESAGSQLLV